MEKYVQVQLFREQNICEARIPKTKQQETKNMLTELILEVWIKRKEKKDEQDQRNCNIEIG